MRTNLYDLYYWHTKILCYLAAHKNLTPFHLILK